jgi:glutamate racemase
MTAVRLAIIDWGIGGISILKLIKKRIGDIPVIYFSDTGVTPYGKMTQPQLVDRLETVIEFLRNQGATHLVVGCNAASTALPFIRGNEMPVVGMIDSAVAAAVNSRPAVLGLIGGRRTVMSGVYHRAFRERSIILKQRVAQPLSGLIESGVTGSDLRRSECRRILKPLNSCSHILLACTHYPAILPVLRQCVNEKTVFIDPAEELVRSLLTWKLRTGEGVDINLTTGANGKIKTAAAAAFDWHIVSARQVKV